ncbi:MAG: hypothetical protein BWY57_02556 [Betaproteobacteria bacterium ADurb.Bin341]|nr:MAG: hypothetical protein BWY57_02556 [Betaproteobacteria bacterium ADurb.Bin341]
MHRLFCNDERIQHHAIGLYELLVCGVCQKRGFRFAPPVAGGVYLLLRVLHGPLCALHNCLRLFHLRAQFSARDGVGEVEERAHGQLRRKVLLRHFHASLRGGWRFGGRIRIKQNLYALLPVVYGTRVHQGVKLGFNARYCLACGLGNTLHGLILRTFGHDVISAPAKEGQRRG